MGTTRPTRSTDNTDHELLVRVASLYYLEDSTQEDIARSLGLSRAKVGRLLKAARDAGIVEISVHIPSQISMPLESELVSRFNLTRAFIVNDHNNEQTTLSVAGRAAAVYLDRIVQPGDTIAVGQGRNVRAAADDTSTHKHRDSHFVSAIGGSMQAANGLNSNDIARKLADKFGGTSIALFAPVYAETPTLRRALIKHDDVRKTLDRARKARIAIIGIGHSGDRSAAVKMGLVPRTVMRQLRSEHAVGGMLGTFFDSAGDAVSPWLAQRVIALTREDLFHIPHVIAIATEPEKSAAVHAALRSGIINVLVSTAPIAREILGCPTSA